MKTSGHYKSESRALPRRLMMLVTSRLLSADNNRAVRMV